MSFRTSELEIDEGLEAGGDELVEEEDRHGADEGHEQKDLPIGGTDVGDN